MNLRLFQSYKGVLRATSDLLSHRRKHQTDNENYNETLTNLQASHLSDRLYFKECFQTLNTATNMQFSYALVMIMTSFVIASALPAAVPGTFTSFLLIS